MSYMVARMQKMKAWNLGGAYRHNERVFENHSNKDIDPDKSHLNYELTERDRGLSYEAQIKDYVNENKISQRAIRKDAVLCDEWIITSDKAFFENLSPEETREFFETAKDYFAQNYGEQNIAYASVHLDESTPHMHMGVVPMRDGKLSSKAMFDREELLKIQDDLPKYMREQGFEIERGARNSEAKHLTVAEFKQEMAYKEIESELVLDYGAPQFMNTNTGEFMTPKEVEEAQSIGELFGDKFELNMRETSFEEKLDWVKNKQNLELKRLDELKKPLEEEVQGLESLLNEKHEELSKIDFKVSEGLSELSEAEEYINTLETRSKALEAKIMAFESENLKLAKQNARLTDLKIMDEGELGQIKPKKGLLGSERVELTKEQFEEFKGLIYRSKNVIHQKELELQQAKNQVPLRGSKNGFEAQLQKAKDKMKGDNVKALKDELKALKDENSVLKQKNAKMADKLKELMPDKAFKLFMDELKKITPIVKVVTKVIEKIINI